MGKNHRHKKDLKAEKAKVKLKQSKTKFLPKGQNVTDTSFKIKAIVLPEQLRSKDGEGVLSKRKLNVKDLLSRLKHYNENVKNSACEELSEMVKIFSEEIVQQSFSDICLTVSSLMQDKDHKIRKAATKVIDVILQYIPKEKLQPFFNYFATNLRCAMTNINRNIQEDSLLFLDCFIKNDCDLIVKNSEKILPDFFTLISKLRNDSSLGRTLTLNLGSKLTSVAWRIKVLSRLHAILSMLLEKEVANGTGKNINEAQIVLATDSIRFPLYKEKFGKCLENYSSVDVFNSAPKNTSLKDREGSLNRHIVTLIPLLYETWLEVMPEQKVQKLATENTVLSEENGALLSCIMNTLYLLWQYINKIGNNEINMEKIFMSNEGKKFLTHLLTNFPYAQPGNRSKKSQKAANSLKILDFNNDPKCVQENLLTCFIYSVLFVNYSQKDLKKELGRVVEYLTKILFQKNTLNQQNSHCITVFLAECLGKSYLKWRKSGADLSTILDSAILFYNHGKMSEDTKLKIFEILSHVIDNDHLKKFPTYKSWLSSLPNILCQEEISDKTTLSLLELSKKNSPEFHMSLVQKLPDILSNFDNIKIKVSGNLPMSNEDTVRQNLVSIFYFVPKYTTSEMDIFTNYIQNGKSEGFAKYFKHIFSLRFDLGKEPVLPSFCKDL